MKQKGFFDEDDRLKELSNLGDPLEKLNKAISWNIFRPAITKALKKEPKGPGGRTPYDYILMFKILILQRLYHISDAQAEYQIRDRLSFMRFLGLTLRYCQLLWMKQKVLFLVRRLLHQPVLHL